MSTQLERDVSDLKTNVAVVATEVKNIGQTLGDIKIAIGKRSDDPTIKLWIKEIISTYIGPDAWRDSAPPVQPTVWASLSEKQRTTVISSVVGFITAGSAILTMIAVNL